MVFFACSDKCIEHYIYYLKLSFIHMKETVQKITNKMQIDSKGNCSDLLDL